MTIVELYRYLHDQVLRALAKHDEAELRSLSMIVEKLYEAAEHCNDIDSCQLLDDMNYLLNETLMGAQAKGEFYLPSIASKLKLMEDADRQNPEK